MIRKVLSRAAVLLPLLAVTSSVFGQAREKSWEIGVFGGANYYANELKLENAYVYGVSIGYNWHPSAEFEFSYATSVPSHLQDVGSTLIEENQLLRREGAEGFLERLAPLPVRFGVPLLRVE